jgi:plasmid maintenance system antidote protein VapI
MPASTSIGQRFTQLIQQLGMSKNAFAQSLDKTATVIQHLVDERNKPGYDLMCKVFEVYPNVSKDWLLLGDGPMLLTTTATAAEPPTATTTAPMAAVAAAPVLTAPELLPAPTPVPSAVETVPPLATSAAPASASSELTASGSEASPVTPTAAPVQAATAPTPLPSPQPMPAIPAAPDVSYLTAALQTQYLQHQLALAEQRNQHLLEQQKLMQQMLNLLQRNTA